MSDPLAGLRARFPGWWFGTVWRSADGPGAVNLMAQRGGVLLCAPCPAALVEKIRLEEAAQDVPAGAGYPPQTPAPAGAQESGETDG
jgi:hypothetical protein